MRQIHRFNITITLTSRVVNTAVLQYFFSTATITAILLFLSTARCTAILSGPYFLQIFKCSYSPIIHVFATVLLDELHNISKLEALGWCVPLPRHVLPNRQQNLTICWLAHCQPWVPWKFYANLFASFYTKLLRDKQTNNDKNNLLGGGTDGVSSCFWVVIFWHPLWIVRH